MKDPFKRCGFPGCNNLVARYKHDAYCQAAHIYLDGMRMPQTYLDEIARIVSREAVRSLVVFQATKSDTTFEGDGFREAVARACCFCAIFFVGNPQMQDGCNGYKYALQESKYHLGKYPNSTIVLFDEFNAENGDVVSGNIHEYYNLLGTYKDGQICNDPLMAGVRLAELIQKQNSLQETEAAKCDTSYAGRVMEKVRLFFGRATN